jgi:hypothetical protein
MPLLVTAADEIPVPFIVNCVVLRTLRIGYAPERTIPPTDTGVLKYTVLYIAGRPLD